MGLRWELIGLVGRMGCRSVISVWRGVTVVLELVLELVLARGVSMMTIRGILIIICAPSTVIDRHIR